MRWVPPYARGIHRPESGCCHECQFCVRIVV